MKKIVFIFFIIGFFCSCTEKKESDFRQRQNKYEEWDQKKKEQIKLSVKKYNMTCTLDTLDLDFSYQYQELFFDNPYQILSDFVVEDIYISDSSYRIYISNMGISKLYFDMELTNDQKKIINLQLSDNNYGFVYSYYLPLFFIIRIENISKVKFEIDPDLDIFGDPSIEIDVKSTYYCKAKIIDIINVNPNIL